ncbi:MAG: hypothetical protein K2J65_02715 [Duncaniella sp.]|nr:hypothetical protein [Duncaniella sp.]MDE6859305.1 hypothetical protein [Duncaniella sp.]MDE7146487.1 hypothetical protein [Duncaniella sp.]
MADKENQLHMLWAELKDTFKLNVDYAKFTAAEKLTVLLTTVTLALLALILVTLIMFFLSMAIVRWIAEGVGIVWAYAIMCAFYVAVLGCIIVFRKQLIINPIAGFISRLFFNP